MEWGTYSKNSNEMFLKIDEQKGRYCILADDVEIEGKLLSKWDARAALYDAFYGKEGKRIMAKQSAVADSHTVSQ